MCAFALRYCRVCLEDSVSFARQRKTFGKRLIDHQVIRHKIVEMASRISASEGFHFLFKPKTQKTQKIYFLQRF